MKTDKEKFAAAMAELGIPLFDGPIRTGTELVICDREGEGDKIRGYSDMHVCFEFDHEGKFIIVGCM